MNLAVSDSYSYARERTVRVGRRRWAPFWRRAVVSGTLAGAAAAALAGCRARAEGSTLCAPMNAVTHCLWPGEAPRATRCSARFTLTGLVIHQAAAVFWATLFEALVPRTPRQRPAAVATAAAATAVTAYVIDYHVVPKRLTPGFEAHLSRRSMAYVYAGIAAGFAVCALWRSGDQ